MTESFEALDRVARCAAGAYKRRGCKADFEDLHQEAWVAIMMAQRSPSFDVSRGTPFEAYAWSAALRWLRGYMWKSGAPVSASYHDLVELRGVAAVEPPDDMVDHTPTPEDALCTKEHEQRVRRAAVRALKPMGDDALPAMLVITGLAAPSELTPEGKRERRELYRALSEARLRLASSLELWQVWKGSKDASR